MIFIHIWCEQAPMLSCISLRGIFAPCCDCPKRHSAFFFSILLLGPCWAKIGTPRIILCVLLQHISHMLEHEKEKSAHLLVLAAESSTVYFCAFFVCSFSLSLFHSLVSLCLTLTYSFFTCSGKESLCHVQFQMFKLL